MRTPVCVCPPRVESLFPPVLPKSCNQIPLAFKVWFSRNSSSRCQTPRLGSLMCGSEPSLQWVDFCGISVLPLVSHPLSCYGIWFYCDYTPPAISLKLLLCLCMWGIFSGEFQCLPVDDCSAVSCDSGALTRGSESTSFYACLIFEWLSRCHSGSRIFRMRRQKDHLCGVYVYLEINKEHQERGFYAQCIQREWFSYPITV